MVYLKLALPLLIALNLSTLGLAIPPRTSLTVALGKQTNADIALHADSVHYHQPVDLQLCPLP